MLYASIELKTRCPKCDNPVMLNGPARTAVCPSCQNSINIHPMEWKSTLGDLPGELKELRMGNGTQSKTLMAAFQRELSVVRENPVCPGCKAPLKGIPEKPKSQTTITCHGCGRPSTVTPPPRWLAKAVPEIDVLVNASIDGEAPEGAGEAPEVAPGTLIHFACPACKGNLKVDGSNRLITCEFCGASIYLPDDLWLRIHPVATVQKWFIGFGEGGKDRKQAKLDSKLLEAAYDEDADEGIEALKKGADPNATDADDRSALFFASAGGVPELVRELLARGAAPDPPDSYGTTPLNIASYNGYDECVSILLEADVDVNHQNKVGVTALNGAAKMGHAEVVKMLLAAGADPSIANEDGQRPEDRAREMGHKDVVKILKRKST